MLIGGALAILRKERIIIMIDEFIVFLSFLLFFL